MEANNIELSLEIEFFKSEPSTSSKCTTTKTTGTTRRNSEKLRQQQSGFAYPNYYEGRVHTLAILYIPCLVFEFGERNIINNLRAKYLFS